MNRRAALSTLTLLGAGTWSCGRKGPSPVTPVAMEDAPGFWVWHRSSALTPVELEPLPDGARIYRQIAEFGWREGKWSPRVVARPEVLLDREVAVVRIDPGPDFLQRADAVEMLARWLRHHFPAGVPTRVQLDHDAPVRLLPKYAAFLRDLRAELGLGEISITALAGWIGAAGFGELGEAVDELVPMFYDLTADPPGDIVAGKARPMAGVEAAGWIGRWKSCRTPWRSGLANFERLTLFSGQGNLVGHLRQWSPESLHAAAFLEPIAGYAGGAGYRVTGDAVYHGTRLTAGQMMVWRAPEDGALRELIAASRAAGARGVVWFALAGPGLRAARSAVHLSALTAGGAALPRLSARRDGDGRVVLRNDGPGDLAPPPGAPPHRLMIAAEVAGRFTDAGPGGFAALRSGVPAKFSRELVLTFPRLLVAEEIASESGLISEQGDGALSWALDDSLFSPLP